jgi:PKD repeat protein
MDSDYSVFSILPPYNTIEAQLIVNGRLVRDGGSYSVTYQAVADPDGSFNSTAMGKGNFYDYAQALYGATLAPEAGLVGWSMPGLSNAPQGMIFESTNHPAAGVATVVNWFRAEGIPIAPYDDALRKNPYPLMRLIAWESSQRPIATNDIVLPVSDEMDCRACHASGTETAARPAAGWLWSGLPERDYRLNILRLHDEHQFARHASLYAAALAARGFDAAGLFWSAAADGQPVLCAVCHASEALGTASYDTIPPLTASVHAGHSHVLDPETQLTLDSYANRAACYRCHPGSATRCLRGAMGGAVAADGSMEMQCQSCHGTMSQVGSPQRVGWFMEPNCQSCHTGTASSNSGQIRFTSAFTDTNGTVRVPANRTFATTPDTPAPGLSLYRFSTGHGGLQCSACHGSTHAEFPSTHRNDNLRNIALQGHAGVLVECTACHTAPPRTINGGPHGLHPVGQAWVNDHEDALKAGQVSRTACQACHGTDYRGTELSRVQAERTFSASGTRRFFRGAIIGCYSCHNGPSGEGRPSGSAPVVANVSTNTPNDQPVSMTLPLTGSGATLRLISQPAQGSVGLVKGIATYYPNPGFVGTDLFTYAAYDGSFNSNLATGTVVVTQAPISVKATVLAPTQAPAGWPVSFAVLPAVANSAGEVQVDWNFGDGTNQGAGWHAAHTYSAPGQYNWTVALSVSGSSATRSGTITITPPPALNAAVSNGLLTLTWDDAAPAFVLERSAALGLSARWVPVAANSSGQPGVFSTPVSDAESAFFRMRRVW